MPAEPECYECSRPLTSDGASFSCWPCARHGYYDRVRLPGGRVIVVRMLTQWRGADGQVRHG